MKENIRGIFMNLGADFCGVANIERFTNTPKGFHPTDVYADCKSVVVFGITLPKGIAKVSSRIIYEHFNSIGPIEVDRISYFASIEIEKLEEYLLRGNKLENYNIFNRISDIDEMTSKFQDDICVIDIKIH